MRNVVIISIIVMSGLSGIAQVKLMEVYQIKDFDSSIVCYVEFYQSGCYRLLLDDHVSSEIVYTLILSNGTFVLKDNECILNDANHSFKIHLTYHKNNTLAVKTGFPFLRNKLFVYYGKNDATDCEINSLSSPIRQKQERMQYNQACNTIFPLTFGVYCYGIDYQLDISKDSTFTWQYKHIVLSEGTWWRKNNELALYDSCLQYSFYVLIDEKGLINKYLPGEYSGRPLVLSPSFEQIPKYILTHLPDMGKDASTLLNQYESAYLNALFQPVRKDFDFANKKIAFLIGRNCDIIRSKKEYFDLEKERFRFKHSKNGGVLYIFDLSQKKATNDYDAAIVYESGLLLRTENVIEILKENINKQK